MINSINRKYLIIVNPIAGGKKPTHIVEDLKNLIDSNPHFTFEMCFSKCHGDVKTIAQKHLHQDFDIFVVIGGDGTVNEVASILVGSSKALGIIPTGSGNGIYNNLYGKINITKAINRIVLYSHIDEIDTGTFGNQFFSNVSGVGFDGLITKLFSKSKKRGLATYLRLVSSHFIKYKPVLYHIKVNGTELNGKYLSVCIANGIEAGNNFILNPKGIMNDGKMELCLIQKPKYYQLPIIFVKVLLKNYDFSNYIKFIPTKTFTITTKEQVSFHVDGNFISEKEKKICFKVNNKLLKVIAK